MSDSFCGSAVDGKDSVAFLDSAIAISQRSGNDFVNLKCQSIEMSTNVSSYLTSYNI